MVHRQVTPYVLVEQFCWTQSTCDKKKLSHYLLRTAVHVLYLEWKKQQKYLNCEDFHRFYATSCWLAASHFVPSHFLTLPCFA